jgi:hypothetical protein
LASHSVFLHGSGISRKWSQMKHGTPVRRWNTRPSMNHTHPILLKLQLVQSLSCFCWGELNYLRPDSINIQSTHCGSLLLSSTLGQWFVSSMKRDLSTTFVYLVSV